VIGGGGMDSFKLQILTPAKEIFDGDVNSISLDIISGRVQILPRHTAFVSGVVPSVVKIVGNNSARYAAVSEGFFEFHDNTGLLLADSVEWAEEIDRERAKNAYEKAIEDSSKKDEKTDVKRAKRALMRAKARMRAAEMKNVEYNGKEQ
jgi:F-type H+-transporting ATPase subunit epsilon